MKVCSYLSAHADTIIKILLFVIYSICFNICILMYFLSVHIFLKTNYFTGGWVMVHRCLHMYCGLGMGR